MANFTTRLNLRKPDPDPMTGDDVDIQEDLNANWDKVDEAVAILEGQINTINSQIRPVMVVYTSDGTFTKANYPWAKRVRVRVQAGGGGGGGAAPTGAGQTSVGGGGGGGGYCEKWIDISALAASETVTVGSGGSGGTPDGVGSGNTGGTSSFGTWCSASGGTGADGGVAGTSQVHVTGGNGGTASGGDINIRGSDGGNGVRGGGWVFSVGQGGASMLGAEKRPNATDAGFAGENGRSYGGGGTGAHNTPNQATGQPGGNGAAGIVIVEVY
ncbi:MAG TPA: hypothetical protein VF202_10810 [Trueperaceae bacterium]